MSLSDNIKAMTMEKYLNWGSNTPDVWAENKRMDFIELKDIKTSIKELKEFNWFLDKEEDWEDTMKRHDDFINEIFGKKLVPVSEDSRNG